jgi:hypothetical protein
VKGTIHGHNDFLQIRYITSMDTVWPLYEGEILCSPQHTQIVLTARLNFCPSGDPSVLVCRSSIHYIDTLNINVHHPFQDSYPLNYLNFFDRNMDPLPQDKPPSQQLHAGITRIAAKALVDKNIPLVEWGQQVQWRCGYPLVLIVRDEIIFHPAT